jgi:O-antigen/teichoic acid export membrane protein
VPILLVFAYGLVDLDLTLCAVVAVIAICEQIGNATYNLSVIESRYSRLVAIVSGKSLFLAIAIAVLLLFAHDWLTLEVVLWGWAVAGLVSLAAIAMGWASVKHPEPHPDAAAQAPIENYTGILDQHKASFTHFITGALAVLIIQIDRLVVGTMLPLAEVGIYFRHVVLVSFAYQFFNVVSYNRKLPKVFELARENHIRQAKGVINREYLMIATIVVLGFAGGVLLDLALEHRITRPLLIDVTLVAVLLGGSLLRIYADFSALILNAQFQEKRVLANQMLGFVVGFAALVGLTWVYGLYGTAFGTLVGAGVYLAMNVISVRNLKRKTDV